MIINDRKKADIDFTRVYITMKHEYKQNFPARIVKE
jgi:hypothetical protein